MGAVPVTIIGTITTRAPKEGGEVSGSGVEQCVIVGLAHLTGVGVGGGPIMPPERPPGIWGGGNEPFPTPPIPIYPGGTPNPPGIWGGGNEPFPTPPIVIPPPGWQPPPNVDPPEAGEPPVAIGGAQPVNPIVVPPVILVNYPGFGWIAVAPPEFDKTTPPGSTATPKK